MPWIGFALTTDGSRMWRGDFKCTTGRAILSVGIVHRAVQDGPIYVAFEFSYQQCYLSLFFIYAVFGKLEKTANISQHHGLFSRETTSQHERRNFN